MHWDAEDDEAVLLALFDLDGALSSDGGSDGELGHGSTKAEEKEEREREQARE